MYSFSGWFEGLSNKFLSCEVPKMLLLAGLTFYFMWFHNFLISVETSKETCIFNNKIPGNVHVVKRIFQIPVFFLSIIYSIVIYIHKNCSLICKLKNLAYIQIKKLPS